MVPGVGQMARPKKGAKRSAPPTDGRMAVIHLKGSPEYVAFLEDVHRRSHIAKATLFRVGFAEWCQRNGYGTPPEL